MTEREFMRRLKSAVERSPEYKIVKWPLHGASFGCQIRLRLHGPDGDFCPIQFVYFEESGSAEEWGRAARLLGLSEAVTSEIVIAADHWDAYQWESPTQKRLAKALGIKEW